MRSCVKQREAHGGGRMVLMLCTSWMHVTADKGKCTGLLLDTCTDAPDMQMQAVTTLVYPGNLMAACTVQLRINKP